MKYFIFIFFLFSYSYTFGQSKQDYVWLWGVDRSPAPGIQGYKFDFKIKPFTITTSNIGVEFDNNNASICDKDGNLLFYSNGCAVLNKEAKIMPDGDSLNFNIWQDLSGWNDCVRLGYPGTQNIMILNDPGNENEYYIIHKPRVFESWENHSMKYLWYSKVDMNLDNGKGDVTNKNIVLYDERQSLSSYLTAIRHANGKDWWIVQPLQEDSLFISFLLTQNGFEKQNFQNSHEFFKESGTSAAGTAKFSPDGTKYALYAYKNNLHIYDFDRNTGVLSNHNKVIIYDSINFGDIRFSSVEWSPNSRFIYVSNELELYQIDTWEENLQDGVRLIGVYDGTLNPFPNTFFLMAQGPDCRIYMCSTSGNETYHVINKPDELGAACDFVQNGIKLPYEAGFGSMPNFPRFRVDEVEKCDPTIVSVFGDYVWYRRDIKVWPNPSSGVFNIELPDVGAGKLVVSNINGQILYDKDMSNIINQEQIDISHYPSGRYNVEFWPEKVKDRVYYGAQVVLSGK
ncbi:MAG TPA: hypothetical protein DCQ58_06460 [Saprospirales bacterium]|nr:hypothetical protein [Saprospirales bacterium]